MSEAAKTPPPAAAPADEGKAKKSSGMKGMIIVIAVVTVVEGAGFYGAMKMFGGGPQVAHGEQTETNHAQGPEPVAHKPTAEVELLTKFRVPNDKSGRLFIYDMDLSVKVDAEHREAFDKLVEERKGELSDRVARIIRSNESEVLHEPDLKSLRMQIRHSVGEMAGDPEMVLEVLIPRFVPMRSD